MKFGDIVQPALKDTGWYWSGGDEFGIKQQSGIIVGFNKKGEGGQDYVHVLKPDGMIEVFIAAALVVIQSKNNRGK